MIFWVFIPVLEATSRTDGRLQELYRSSDITKAT